MVAKSKPVTNLSDWTAWLRSNAVAARHLRGARKSDPIGYFLRTHALTETLLRRTLLVGLRRKGARYSDALKWLDDSDLTPSRSNYPSAFDALFSGSITFANLIPAKSALLELWDLWIDYTKVVRNHLGHGVRTYSFDWLQLGVQIDQAFIMRFCREIEPHVGGRLGADLRNLRPRLGMGKPGVDIAKLLGRKSGKPRPVVSLQAADRRFRGLGIK
jgi:hypothetical protein